MERDRERMDWQKRWATHDTPWDHGEAAPPLVDWLATHPLAGNVLVPGCGRGHEVRLVAAHGAARVLGLDLAPDAVAAAAALPKAGNEVYAAGDFLQLETRYVGAFDALVEHTCFCAIDPDDRPAYAKSAAQALKPGGLLIGVFYLNPQSPVGPPFGVERAELASLFAESFKVVDAFIPPRAFEGREGREEVRILERMG